MPSPPEKFCDPYYCTIAPADLDGRVRGGTMTPAGRIIALSVSWINLIRRLLSSGQSEKHDESDNETDNGHDDVDAQAKDVRGLILSLIHI